MSLAYCFDCLVRFDQCKCENPSGELIYGDLRVAYQQGYRDAKKEGMNETN